MNVERLLLERFGTNASLLGFRVFTARSTGERLDLVADSRSFRPGTVEPARPAFKRTMEMRLYYRRLMVDAWSTAAFEAQARVMEALHAANSELLLAYREREGLSRDLHDGSIQNFYALGLNLQRVQALFDGPPQQAQCELKESVAMLDHSIEDLRQFILTAASTT